MLFTLSVSGDAGDSMNRTRGTDFSRPEAKGDLADADAEHSLQQNVGHNVDKSATVVTGAHIPSPVTHNAMQVALGSFDDEILCTQRRRPPSDSGKPLVCVSLVPF